MYEDLAEKTQSCVKNGVNGETMKIYNDSGPDVIYDIIKWIRNIVGI
jgi:hypothetical protein